MAKDSKNDEAWNKQIEYMTNEIRKEEDKNYDLQQRIDAVLKYVNNLLKSDEVPYIDAVLITIQEILKGDDTNES